MKNNDCFYRAMSVIDKVDTIRQLRGITMCQMSKIMGFSEPYYYSIYNAYRIIKVDTLVNIARGLNVNVGYLLGNEKIGDFEEIEVSYDKIVNYRLKGGGSLAAIKSKIKKNKTKSITIKTLFEFEEKFKIPAIELIKNPA